MTQAILTLNAGSSSLKLALYPLTGDRPMATGLVDAIGPAAVFRLKGPFGQEIPTVAGDLSTHAAALQTVVASLRGTHPDLTLLCIGHRVLHGGDHFSAPLSLIHI